MNDDGKTVDLVLEKVVGLQREERLNNLLDRMKAMHIPEEELWW